MITPSKIITANAIKWAESLKKIEVISVPDGMPLMNSKCQYNSLNQVRLGKAIAVAEVVMVSKGKITAHYINMNSQGEYYDITLGWSWAGGDYRLVRLIAADSSELDSASEMLGNLKKKMYEMTPIYIRALHNGNKWDVF